MFFLKPSGKQNHEVPGLTSALKIFHDAAKRVPAYKDFLKTHNIDPATIVDAETFKTVPIQTKKNYFTKYPLQDMAWDGRITDARIISMSSGSTGQPFLWPRGNSTTHDAADILDELYDRVYHTRTKNTLCIVAYAMGTWIAGTYMLSALYELADRGHKIVSITPGINQEEIIQIIKRIGGEYDQVLIMGYAPFIKDAMDTAIGQNVDLAKYNLKFMFSSEHITETWRRYVLDMVTPGYGTENSLSLYGAAEMGIAGMETPLIVYLRGIIANDKALFQRLFGDTTTLPVLVYYEPDLRYVEEVDSHFIFTLNSSLPLIRYNLMDQGRLLNQEDLIEEVEAAGYSVPKSLSRWPNKPLIALYGRSDVSAMFYGVNIYPENIKYALEIPELQTYVSGKFTVQTVFDAQQEQSLQIAIELKKDARLQKRTTDKILATITGCLLENNSEYRKLSEVIGAKAEPNLVFIEHGSPEFQIGKKHKWVASEKKPS
jgi:phenylacetate-CoA ligase